MTTSKRMNFQSGTLKHYLVRFLLCIHIDSFIVIVMKVAAPTQAIVP